MATTGPLTSPLVNGVTQYYGMQVGGQQGAMITSLKVYDFTVATSTLVPSSTGVYARAQTVSGLTTNDIFLAIQPTTGPWANGFVSGRVSGANTLELSFAGLSTSNPTAQLAQLATLVTFSYANQSSSTTT